MKLFTLLLTLLVTYTAQTQVRQNNKTRQIEQLQQLKETVTRKIDTLHSQLAEQATSMEDTRKKLDQLKRETNAQDKPDMASREQATKLSAQLSVIEDLANKLQKQFDQRLVALDKAITLQKDLEDKINTLTKESNQ